MKIYRSEIVAGLEPVIKNSNSVAYSSVLYPVDATPEVIEGMKSIASTIPTSSTLYPLRDILVTTSRNRNFDVFDKVEVWKAKLTPLFHPFNLQHDEKNIIGCIADSFPVDVNYNPIPLDTPIEELPDKYHIINNSVIYTVWEDEEQRSFIQKVISEIKRGEWFVSMECTFNDFDYEVMDSEGRTKIVARNEETAFLTMYLRQYGGTGKYTDKATGKTYSLARVLRDISFIGKGLVRTPANPDSLILNLEEVSVITAANESLGYINTDGDNESTKSEINNMAEVNQDVLRLESELVKATEQIESLKKELNDRDGKNAQAQIETLKSDVTNRDERIKTLEASVAELKETVSSLTSRAEVAEKEAATLKAEKVEAGRLKLLTDKGASVEKAAEMVKKFSRFNEEEFVELVETVSAAWKKSESKEESDKVVASAKNPQDVIDEAVKNKETPLSTPSEDEDVERKERISKASAFFFG